MDSLSTGFSGLTRAQAELVSHWRTCCQSGQLPTRDRLDPGAIRAHLSAISIVEIDASGRTRFRLAGSDLRQVFGRDMRGRSLSELDQSTFEIWSLGLARALDLRAPVGGLVRGEFESHAWLRLPLNDPRDGTLVLCHDTLIPNVRLGLKPNSESHKTRHGVSDLAA